MDLSDLLKQGVVRKAEPDRVQARECLKGAERDLKAARELLGKDSDWAFSIAYNSMLQVVRALIFADGYRICGEDRHKTVVEYAQVKLGETFAEKVRLFNRMRVKRHLIIYEKVNVVSEYEAKFAVKTAEEFLKKIKGKIKLRD
jgi:uncharacterized protein (UPF0332 family)